MSSIDPSMDFGLELDPKTAIALTRFARRRRRLLIVRAIAAGILMLIASMALVALFDYLWVLGDPLRWIMSLFAYGATVGAMWWFGFRHLGRRDPRRLARQLEAAAPSLREDLLSAVELADPTDTNGSMGFRRTLQRSVARRTSGLDIGQLLPIDLILRWLIGGLAMLVVCGGLMFLPQIQFGRRIARALLPGAPIQRASLTDLQILQPSPPSGYVAEGDAVGVTVQVTGASRQEVWLQWRTDEAQGETAMTPRVVESESSSDGTLGHQGQFSANVSVGSIPLQYRVMAGDAITLWHELTPLPRPQVESFSKRYEFPEYAALPPRAEEAEHGDLKALVGTMAYVTIRFNQPVTDAVLRYGNRGATVNLDPIAGTENEFLAKIPIRTPTTYQIDATSSQSGLRNPFSPQYAVSPIIDTPPSARWDESLPNSIVVSPLDVVSLRAIASDDLPMERVVHEFQINDQEVRRRQRPVDEPSRELDLSWDWDLMHRLATDDESEQLRSGDIVRMRLVAIDRKGQRGESTFIELLIAEEGFDSDRHKRFEQLRQWAQSVTQWVDRSRELMNLMKLSAETSDWQTIDQSAENAVTLLNDFEAVQTLTLGALSTARFDAEAATIELLGRALQDHRIKLRTWFDEATIQNGTEKPDDLIHQAQGLTMEGLRIDQLTRAMIAEFLTAAVMADASALDRSLDPMTHPEQPLPQQRFPRYLTVTLGRMQEIGALIRGTESVLPESTVRHLEVWYRMSDQWKSRLDELVFQPGSDSSVATVREFQGQLRRMTDQSMVDGRISPSVVNLTRDIRFQIGGTGDQIHAIDREGRLASELRTRAESTTDSAEVADLNRQTREATERYIRGRDQLLARLVAEEQLHRRRPKVDLQYAADLDLIRRAIENVSSEGYQPYKEESPQVIHQKLARAFQVIEASHEANLWLNELRALLLAERQLDENEITKILHPTWIERVPSGLDWPARTLQNVGVNEVPQQIDRVRYGDDYNQSRERITQRRWSGEPMLSAETSIDALQQALATALKPLSLPVIEARETIEQYVLSLAEQARQAAEEAREAEAANRSREDSKPETVKQLDAEHEQAVEAAKETIESLVDYANTIDLSDANQREMARDADAAAAKIQADLQRAEQAMQQAGRRDNETQRGESLDQAADAMRDLAESLDQTAAHFERAQDGEDVAQSRQALREAEAALQMQQEMQDPYARTEALAEAANQNPRELLERLEQELQDNQPMQEELSEIAEQAAENAARMLESSAREERGLNQSLQRSDAAFQEQKRQLAEQINNLARRTATVDEALLQATERAIGWANAPQWQPKLNQAREQLRSATRRANEMGGENALLSEMQQTATDMSRAMKDASDALAEVNQMAVEAQQDDLHQDESGRKRAIDQLQRMMRDARAIQLRASNDETQRLSASKRDAARRVQQMQRQKRDADNQASQLEERIRNEPNNAEAIKPQLEAARKRVEEASNAEQAARESVELADSMLQDAQQRGDELKKQSLPELQQKNPAAEMARAMTDQADAELDAIQSDLQQLAQQADIKSELRLPIDQAQNMINQQARIADNVGQAVEQLRRAARHEQRLGREALAEQLDAVADGVQQASQATETATEALQQAAENNQQTPQADTQLAQATENIRQAAEQVGQLLATAMPQSSAPAQSPASEEQRQGQQLARTLDELDRALNQPQTGQPQSGQPGQTPGEQSPADPSQANPSEAGQPSPSQQGQPGQEQQNQGQPSEGQQGQAKTAGEASQTLSDALAQQAQNAARQRGQQLQGESQSQGQAPSQSQSSDSNSASAEPGSGTAEGGDFVETMGIERLGSDWGQLRERRTEDAAESRGATIAPQYRREIEAYFRAVARRAAESNEPVGQD